MPKTWTPTQQETAAAVEHHTQFVKDYNEKHLDTIASFQVLSNGNVVLTIRKKDLRDKVIQPPTGGNP